MLPSALCPVFWSTSSVGGNSTRRALSSDNDKRASAIGSLFGDLLDDSGSIGKVLGNGLLSGMASGAGAIGLSEH
jgi:hypothetical protein